MKDFPEKPGYIEIPHPADVSVAVTAESRRMLFLNSLIAMGDIAGIEILDDSTSPGEFTVNGNSNEDLLVAFLNEINYILENGSWPTEINLEIGPTFLKCTYCVKKCVSNGYEIKAVTFSEMHIFKKNDYWYTRIVFDV